MNRFEQPELPADSSPFVCLGPDVNSNYSVSLLVVDQDTGSPALQVILISRFEGKTLVALPHSVWHRQVARRILPPGSLAKATLVEVAACSAGRMDQVLDDVAVKVWIGFLREELMENLATHLAVLETDYVFDPPDCEMLPYAQALVEVANEHFSFFSAEEGIAGIDGEPLTREDEARLAEGSGLRDIGPRMDHLEASMEAISESMARLLSVHDVQSGSTGVSAPKTAKKAINASGGQQNLGGGRSLLSSKPKKAAASSAGSKATKAADFPALDSSVVAAALKAGVPRESLAEMEKVLLTNTKALKAKDLNPMVKVTDPLSEEEEGSLITLQEEEEEESGSPADPMTATLGKLTSLLDLLTADKIKKKNASKLEAALDSVTTSSSQDTVSLGSGKKTAAARRVLRSLLHEQRVLSEDLNSQTLGPGQTALGFNARAWIEFRSNIGNYKTSAHASWGVAGALDALVQGKVHQARARLCLLLLQLDQASIDRGNWSFAAELSLEQLPPFSSLATHSGPAINEGEQPFSRLLDARWAEITMGHLKEQDDYLIRRRNIGKMARSTGDTDLTDPEAKKRAKAKAKAKSSPQGLQDA